MYVDRGVLVHGAIAVGIVIIHRGRNKRRDRRLIVIHPPLGDALDFALEIRSARIRIVISVTGDECVRHALRRLSAGGHQAGGGDIAIGHDGRGIRRLRQRADGISGLRRVAIGIVSINGGIPIGIRGRSRLARRD